MQMTAPSFSKKRKLGMSMVLAGFMMLMTPGNAFALCEPAGIAAASAGTASGTLQAALAAQYVTLSTTSELTILTALQAPVNLATEKMSRLVFDRMNSFWSDWQDAWKGMAAQLSAGTLDQTRQLASIDDSTNTVGPILETQKEEYQAKKTYQPNERSCTFDTASRYAGSSSRRSKAVSSALSNDLTKVGSNKKGTAAAQGAAALKRERWTNYVTNFCDPAANSKNAGCTQPGKDMNADIQPSKTIFMRDTLDMEDKDTRTAVQELVFNLSDYKVQEPMPVSVLKTPNGREQRAKNRSYLTQMDGVSGLVNAIVADRTPGEKAEDIQALRMKMGVPSCPGSGVSAIACASPTPSEREIRQARIEELRDPSFYVGLSDTSNSTLQKEVMLQALNLSMLYKIIESTEKISNVYAIETGNMLQKSDTSRNSGNKYLPQQ